MSISQHATFHVWIIKENISSSAGLSVFVSPCLTVDPWSQTGTVQLTVKLAADWQLKSKTWNMLCFSTSQQTTPWGGIVNFNGLFSLETHMCVCVCMRLCVFILKRGGIKIAMGLCGLVTSRSVNWPTWLFPCNAYFHRQTCNYHTHMYGNTHLLKAKSKHRVKSAFARCYFLPQSWQVAFIICEFWRLSILMLCVFKAGIGNIKLAVALDS